MLTIRDSFNSIQCSDDDNYEACLGRGGFEQILIEKYFLLLNTSVRHNARIPVLIDVVIDMYLEDVERLVRNYNDTRYFTSQRTSDPLDERTKLMIISDDMFTIEVEALSFAENLLKKNHFAYRKAIYGNGCFHLEEIGEGYTPQFLLLNSLREED